MRVCACVACFGLNVFNMRKRRAQDYRTKCDKTLAHCLLYFFEVVVEPFVEFIVFFECN